jgi:hypothetical protein
MGRAMESPNNLLPHQFVNFVGSEFEYATVIDFAQRFTY